MKLLRSSDRGFDAAVQKVARRGRTDTGKVERAVRAILRAVERGGDQAVLRYVKKFDRVSLRPQHLRVPATEVKDAYGKIREDEVDALRLAAQRVAAFHERQRVTTWTYQEDGTTLGQVVLPLDAVGVYVPGGKAVYPSSVLMAAIPAKVAGVRRIVMCTPSGQAGINPYLLVAADLAGVDEIYRIGGVQAVGAMAYGTKTIAPVDKIVGPGNIFVATAKRLLYGTVGIDMVAGPSELLVLADEQAEPDLVAADLLCEAEHDEDAKVWLVTPSADLAKKAARALEGRLKKAARSAILRKSIARHAMIFVVDSMAQGVEVANTIAAEHVALSVERPFDYVEQVRHAGALFLGRYTPPAVADYLAGPNHVLPTGGSARFFSALSVHDYVKIGNIVAYGKEALARVKAPLVRLALMEGLEAHAQSAESRFA